MNKHNKTLSRLLIANRGEIAIRIMKSAQAMGIHCIALYSDADEHAQHVKKADEAWYIGPSPAKDSYLNVAKILQIAQQSNADGVHPGYGFLSENPGFAQAIKKAGLIWIGPPVNAIEAMGSKSESKAIMEKANVPLVPGYHGDNQDDAFLTQQILHLGFPVLIKASAGGGGKGMRVVENEQSIAAAILGAKREGLNSFGDDKLLVEKYITRPRHVEIQVFLDELGNGVYLFERDCSIQRRHQKILEEAPAPDFPQAHREAMGEAALKAAKAIHYVGAGTVEFLYDPSQTDSPFYFMEMNTRLQVEHPVTEMITGLDLVAWQIKVAQGGKLALSQDQLSIHGHAIEVRVYAEDPDNDFLPTTGKIAYLQTPKLIDQRVRLDSGVQQGDEISPFYDPMISKLIVWGEDRAACINQLKLALQAYQISGITTNLGFLRKIVEVDDFKQGKVNTQFIDAHTTELNSPEAASHHHLIAAVCQRILTRDKHMLKNKQDSNNPWHNHSSFRLNQQSIETLTLISLGNPIKLNVEHINNHIQTNQWKITIHDQTYLVCANLEGTRLHYQLNGVWQYANVLSHNNHTLVYDEKSQSQFEYPQRNYNQVHQQQGSLTAPMNGTIIQINGKVGQPVKSGDTLIIMEAMKMEHAIKAPKDGVIEAVFFNVGDLVNEGNQLIDLAEA
ncbi:acetyl/propionyl/methylcrotonyl-CoA carboxylase subunit alpha [Oceaniserpentilla sp. 4NH20-0058]|uniref:acetyl/propionyl/methylcrotonyl-CoA carboxylase subunit alpha n=1 Tax=Oceaniserpentilla sp. 4NH20-0058 TaxID=3127660 RepID=UPI003109FFE3